MNRRVKRRNRLLIPCLLLLAFLSTIYFGRKIVPTEETSGEVHRVQVATQIHSSMHDSDGHLKRTNHTLAYLTRLVELTNRLQTPPRAAGGPLLSNADSSQPADTSGKDSRTSETQSPAF